MEPIERDAHNFTSDLARVMAEAEALTRAAVLPYRAGWPWTAHAYGARDAIIARRRAS